MSKWIDKRIYRIYIASTIRLLESERSILSNEILRRGHLPIQMEYDFDTTSADYSIELDKRKMDSADCIIFIISYLYGEIIDEKIGNKIECKLKNYNFQNCMGCYGTGCNISFTNYEYLYAIAKEKPYFIILNTHYDDLSNFIEANKIWMEKYSDKINNDEFYLKDFYAKLDKNKFFVDQVKNKHVYEYFDETSFQNVCTRAVSAAIEKLNSKDCVGLIPYSQYINLNNKSKILEEEIEKLKNDGIVSVFANQSEAIKSLKNVNEKDIYEYMNKKQKTRVLAIRGDSFIHMGKQWAEYIWHSGIEVEFILGDENNEKIIQNRFTAFVTNKNDISEYEAFKNGYKHDMRSAHDLISKHDKCKLLIHPLDKLPFRMIFIGQFLYLSSFVSDKKADEAPVIVIKRDSSLYQTCEEYYNWIASLSRDYQS